MINNHSEAKHWYVPKLRWLSLCLAIVLVALFSLSHADAQDFAYRYTIRINNTSGSTITNQFIPLINPTTSAGMVNALSLVTNGYVQADGDDIQFIRGSDVWPGSAQDIDSNSAVWWTFVDSLESGYALDQHINIGDPAATSTTVDQGLGLYGNGTITMQDDPDIDLTDDLALELDLRLFDLETAISSTDVRLADKQGGADTAYGFLMDVGSQNLNADLGGDSNHDDYWNAASCSGNLNDLQVLNMGDSGANAWSTYVIFPYIAVPPGMTISSAVVTFTASSNQSGDTVRLNIYAADADDVPTPPDVGGQTEVCAYDLTTEFVSWDGLAAWTTGNTYTTPDISAVVQEVVDRPGWQANNAIMIQVRNDSSDNNAYRIARAREQGSEAYIDLAYSSTASSTAVLLRARADTEELTDEWDGEQATFRLWYTTDGPIYALTKDGVHVASDNTVSGAITANGTNLLADPNETAYYRDIRVITGVGIDYTNLVTNPSVEESITGYTDRTANTTITPSSAQSNYGNDSVLATLNTSASTSDGFYFDLTNDTASSTQYTAGVDCLSGGGETSWRLQFSDDATGSEAFYAQTAATLNTSTWTRLTTTASLATGSSYRRINVTPANAITATTTVYCDGLQVETGATANTYADGSNGSNAVWDGTAHASVTHVPQAGTNAAFLDFEPANLAQTQAGASGNSWTWQGTVTDTAENTTATYELTSDATAVSSTIVAMNITAETSYQGTVAEETPQTVPTPVAPTGYASETGTGSGYAFIYPFANIIATTTEWSLTVIWYGIAGIFTMLVGIIAYMWGKHYWVAFILSAFMLATFPLAGAIAWWVIFVYVMMGTAVGLSDRIMA